MKSYGDLVILSDEYEYINFVSGELAYDYIDNSVKLDSDETIEWVKEIPNEIFYKLSISEILD